LPHALLPVSAQSPSAIEPEGLRLSSLDKKNTAEYLQQWQSDRLRFCPQQLFQPDLLVTRNLLCAADGAAKQKWRGKICSHTDAASASALEDANSASNDYTNTENM
jgi:hypothetical protein